MASKHTTAQVEWVPGEDGKPRLTAAPVAYTPPVLPQRWPGGEPRFPVDTRFYLAVQRAELAHLAHHAKAFRDLVGDGEPPPELRTEVLAMARDVERYSWALRAYEEGWSSVFPSSWYGPPDWLSFHLSLGALVRMHWSMRDEHTTTIEFARRASTPAMLLKYDVILRRAPDLEIDFRLIPPKPRPEPEAVAPAETPADGPEPTEAPEAPDETMKGSAIEAACRALGKATTGIGLVRFLVGRDGQRAELEVIAKEVQGKRFPDKGDLKAARRLAERTRDAMEASGCPLRLEISANVASLTHK